MNVRKERQTIDLPCRECGDIFTDWRDVHETKEADGTIRLSHSTVCAGCKEARRIINAAAYCARFAQRDDSPLTED